MVTKPHEPPSTSGGQAKILHIAGKLKGHGSHVSKDFTRGPYILLNIEPYCMSMASSGPNIHNIDSGSSSSWLRTGRPLRPQQRAAHAIFDASLPEKAAG